MKHNYPMLIYLDKDFFSAKWILRNSIGVFEHDHNLQ